MRDDNHIVVGTYNFFFHRKPLLFFVSSSHSWKEIEKQIISWLYFFAL